VRTVLSMIRKEFIQIRRDPRLIPILFISPVLQLLLLGFAANLDVKDIPAVVCDTDLSRASRDFLDDFLNSGYFSEKKRVFKMDEIDACLDNGEAAVAFVVPPGFGDRIAAREKARVLIIVDGSESQSATVGVSYASMIVGRRAQKIVLEVVERLKTRGVRPVVVRPEVRVWYNPELRSRNFMVPGVLGLILMVMTMMLTSMAVVREKEMGTMEQLLVTPIRPSELLAGKLLPFVLIGLMDAAIVVSVARWGFGVPVRGSVPLLGLLSLAFMLNTLGIGLFISTISRNQQQAMLTAVFFLLPMMLLGGFVFPIENMPAPIRAVTVVVPIRYFFTIIRGLMLKGAGWAELWDEALALLVLGFLILALSIARFRKKIE
jgi:ABC-2 type transport system permease protein